MTKMELVKRILVVTRGTIAPAIVDRLIEATLMDCVEGFAETLLSRVKLETEQALQVAITDTLERLKNEGRDG